MKLIPFIFLFFIRCTPRSLVSRLFCRVLQFITRSSSLRSESKGVFRCSRVNEIEADSSLLNLPGLSLV